MEISNNNDTLKRCSSLLNFPLKIHNVPPLVFQNHFEVLFLSFFKFSKFQILTPFLLKREFVRLEIVKTRDFSSDMPCGF